MNYNDFPILNDDKYKMIQAEYEKFLPFNRKNIITKIYLLLEECRHLCFGLNKRFNTHIDFAINDTKHELERVMDNFHSIFNIKPDYKKEIAEFNLFHFLKKLINCIKEILAWNSKEDKEYYKKFSDSTLNILLTCISNLIQSLENSNIHIFKFM